MTLSIDEKQLTEFKQIFNLFDEDRDGKITINELTQAMISLGENPTKTDVRALLGKADVDGNNAIDFGEFLTIITSKTKESNTNSHKNEIIKAFQVFDKDGNGFISTTEFKNVMMNATYSKKLSNKDIEEMISQIDINKDGQINYQEFVKIML